MKTNQILAGALVFALLACSKKEDGTVLPNEEMAARGGGSTSLGIVGSAADFTTPTTGGVILMGGGTDVDAAMKWMIAKSGGGDIIVLRASGTNAYNSYIYGLGTCNSVETLLINSTTKANDATVEAKILAAEAVFIAGGDQNDYVRFWRNTKVESALNYLRNTKKCVIGGTSAGCMIMGKYFYTAQNGSVYSDEALNNPYINYVTIGSNDFLALPNMDNFITDTHFSARDRMGRLVTFLARMSKDNGIVSSGLGVDEATAVCLEADGTSKVFGSGFAFFLKQANGAPETCVSGQKLNWVRSNQAVSCYKVAGTSNGSNTFNFNSWTGTGGSSYYHYVSTGLLKVN